jgi:hypothetical protein
MNFFNPENQPITIQSDIYKNLVMQVSFLLQFSRKYS